MNSLPTDPAQPPVMTPASSMNRTDDVAYLSIRELSRRLAAREISAVELTQRYLQRIDEHNAEVNAFITVDKKYSLAQARHADRCLAAGDEHHPLTGIPVALKDTIPTAGLRTTAGSRVLSEWVPDADPPVVDRLRSCGAVVIGKTNLHEFAYGGTSENEHFGPVRNPWDPRRVAGGSSGGSAAAVAAGLAAAAIGTDAAGSVRIPACHCGTVGFKPTYGRVPTEGLIPLGWSLDHVGPITRTVWDAELLCDAMSGRPRPGHPGATASVSSAPPRVEGLRVGLPRRYAFEGVDPGIADRVEGAFAALRSLGVMVEDVDIPGLELSTATVYTIIAGEASAYHSRWWPERVEEYGADIRRKLEAAARLSADDYVQAHRVRAQIVEAFAAALEQVDAIVTPTAPLIPQLVGQKEVDFGGHRRPATGGGVFTRLTAPFNLSGGPAISVPCGLTPGGMPAGLQIASAPGRDELVLRLAAAYEHEAPSHATPAEPSHQAPHPTGHDQRRHHEYR
jgi:aspartyl-tRNA(Asn)/glutamyl-tRNA(Gln) amidotransferase subunit A